MQLSLIGNPILAFELNRRLSDTRDLVFHARSPKSNYEKSWVTSLMRLWLQCSKIVFDLKSTMPLHIIAFVSLYCMQQQHDTLHRMVASCY